MLYGNLKGLIRIISFTFVLISGIGMTAKAGGETYSIYLNKKLLFTRHVHSNNSLEIKTLELGKANYDDQLVIYYYGCGPVAKDRSIVIKDNDGKVLKKWAFGDSKEGGAMSIPVKEILALEKNNGGAKTNLYYYSSNTVPKGRMLAPVALGDEKKSVTTRDERATNEWPTWAVRKLAFSIFSFVGLMS
jgi:hypothetical protein